MARLADPDPWRNRLREVLQNSSSQERLTNLKDLAKSAPIDELPAVSLHLLGATLLDMGETTGAESVLRQGQRRYPSDLWLNYSLAQCLDRLGHHEEAIRYHMAARSLRPETSHLLAHSLQSKGEMDQAVAVFRDLERLRPNDARHQVCLGVALQARGRTQEANEVLANAVFLSRETIRLKPESHVAHLALGRALYHQGRLDDAVAEYRESLRLRPGVAQAQYELGRALRDGGKLNEAIDAYRGAIRINPEFTTAHGDLGAALSQQGKLNEAIEEFRVALRLNPASAEAHNNLGMMLRNQGKLHEAIDEYHKALRLDSDLAAAHLGLGNALKDEGKLDQAIDEYRVALRLKADYAETHCNLGLLLQTKGLYAEALASLRRGHELGSKRPNWPYPSAEWVRQAGRKVELDRKLVAVLKGEAHPADGAEWLTLAKICSDRRWHATAARFWDQAFQADGKVANDLRSANRYNAACAAASAGCGQGKDNPPLDEQTKTRWRKQAVDWLKADLMSWSKALEQGPPQAREFVIRVLHHSRIDDQLAGLREPVALAKLPEDEQKACRALWAEVDALLAKSGQTTRP